LPDSLATPLIKERLFKTQWQWMNNATEKKVPH